MASPSHVTSSRLQTAYRRRSKRDEKLKKTPGEAHAAVPASAASHRIKKGEEKIDSMNLRHADPNAKDKYGYPITPLHCTAGTSQEMFARMRPHGELDSAYEKAMLEDRVVNARKEDRSVIRKPAAQKK